MFCYGPDQGLKSGLLSIQRPTPSLRLFIGPTDPRWTQIDFAQEKRLVADPFLPEDLIADREPTRCAITRITAADVLAATGQLLAASGTEADGARVATQAPTPPDT